MGEFRLLDFTGLVVKHLPKEGKLKFYYLDGKNRLYRYQCDEEDKCYWVELKNYCNYTFLDLCTQKVYIVNPEEKERKVYPSDSLLLECKTKELLKFDCQTCTWKPICNLKCKSNSCEVGCTNDITFLPSGPIGLTGPNILSHSKCGKNLTLWGRYTPEPGTFISNPVIEFNTADFGGPFKIDLDCSSGNFLFGGTSFLPMYPGIVYVRDGTVFPNDYRLVFDFINISSQVQPGDVLSFSVNCVLTH